MLVVWNCRKPYWALKVAGTTAGDVCFYYFASESLDRLECGAPQACDVEPVLSRRVLLLARRALKAAGPAYPPLTGAAGSCDERAAAASRRPRCRRDVISAAATMMS